MMARNRKMACPPGSPDHHSGKPDHPSGSPGRPLERRRFLGALGGLALTWPRTLEALGRRLEGGGSPDDEPFWEFVRSQFLIPPDRIYLNNGTLGPSPAVVVEAVAEHQRRVAATFPPGVDWDDLKGAVGGFLGADPEGLVFPRNTTEAMTFIAQGLDFEPGQEVLTSDHEHIGGRCPWEVVSQRRGVGLRVFALPLPPQSPEALLESITSSLAPSTRVLSLSQVTFTTGTRLPVERLAPICKDRGILLVVDGAHPPGMMALNLSSWTPEFYASSPHKWMLAPQGTGLLYMSEPWRGVLWPTLASGGWDETDLGAQRFNHLGTFDESRMAGLLSAVRFMETLGMPRVEGRIRYLRSRLESGLRDMNGVKVVTPRGEDLSAGMVSFSMEGVDSLELQRHLAQVAQVRTRVISEYGYGWMRLSTHVYNLPGEIEKVLELLQDVTRNGLP